MFARKPITVTFVAIFLMICSGVAGYAIHEAQDRRRVDTALLERASRAIERKWPVELSSRLGYFGDFGVSQIEFGYETCINFRLRGYLVYGRSYIYCESKLGPVTRLYAT
jgi:hypothetical protein